MNSMSDEPSVQTLGDLFRERLTEASGPFGVHAIQAIAVVPEESTAATFDPLDQLESKDRSTRQRR